MRCLDITFVKRILYYISKLKIDLKSYQWLLWLKKVHKYTHNQLGYITLNYMNEFNQSRVV